jgi:Flp pilus assembly protein TadG
MTAKKLLSKLNPRLKWRGIRGIRYNEEGISAIEFALIAPLMILLFFGCIELSMMMRLDRRVTTTSSSLGDLTARLATVTDADMAQMFSAAELMMQPYDVSNARMRITSIVDDGDGVTKVAWSDGSGMSAHSVGSTLLVPTGIIPSPGSAILAEVEYDYVNQFGYILDMSRTLTDDFYLRPRRVEQVARESDGNDDGGGFGPSS